MLKIINLDEGVKTKPKTKKSKEKTKRNDSFKYLFSEYLLIMYYMPGTVLSPEVIFLLSIYL